MTTTTPPAGYAELVARDQWVNAGRDKIPYTPSLAGEKKPACADDPATFRAFAEADAARAARRFPHVGYEFTEGDPHFLIDLDHQRDPATGQLTPLARAIMVIADTLAEPSISGAGLHLIGRAPVPRDLLDAGRLGKKAGPCEIYFGGHYGIMTFRPLPGHDQIRDVDDETIRLLFRLMFPAAPQAAPAPPPPAPLARLDDAAVLDKACAAKGGEDFRRQHEGAYLQHDKSADDYGYLGHLHFWCQGDPPQMRRLAEASGRRRDKWFTRRGDTDWLGYSIARICRAGGPVYDPGTAHRRTTADPPGDDAHACPRCGQLEAELRAEQEEGARMVERVTDLETEVAALEASIAHPVQAAGVGALDLFEEAQRSYEQGTVLTRDGKDYSRTTFAGAARRRSPNTLARGFAEMCEAGTIDAFTHKEDFQLPNGKKKTIDIAYIYLPEELRGRRGRAVLSMLPAAGEKRHGGRRTIEVPPEVAAQEHPVRRKREHVTRWSDALTGDKLAVRIEHLGTDFWTAAGEQLTPEEVTRQRVELGYEPARPAAGEAPGRQDDDKIQDATCRQDDAREEPFAQPPLPLDIPGECQDADCHRKAVTAGYCAAHYAEQLERHKPAWGYAAVAD